MRKKHSNIQELCTVGLTCALLCILAPISIPTPLGIPATLQSFIITLIAIVMNPKQSVTACITYIILGAFGLPIFSNFTGGWQMLIGPTGGFLLSFPIMAYIISKMPNAFGITIGTITNFTSGLLMYCFITNSNVQIGLTTCVIPFIPIALVKAYLAYLIGKNIRKRLNQLQIVD